jgi:hypothetical protein
MQCSDPKAADVSCGGTMSTNSVYVFKGKQGECAQHVLWAGICKRWH